MKQPYRFREINYESEEELDLITHNCMQTVLETVPEFDGNMDKVRQHFSNFSFLQMRAMIKGNFGHPYHRFLVATNAQEELVGQAIFSVKEDDQGLKYGFCFSRYVHPKHRRQGIAKELLTRAETWWRKHNISYAIAHTHVTNLKLQGLFEQFGFVKIKKTMDSAYSYYTLRKQY